MKIIIEPGRKKLWIGKETTTEDISNQIRKYLHCRKHSAVLTNNNNNNWISTLQLIFKF